MFIAPNAKVLFIHVNKAAGDAITHYLATHVVDADAVKIVKNSSSVRIFGQYLSGLGKHSKAARLRRLLPDYDQYLSFCFARNPWDRAASWYEYLRRGVGLPSRGVATSLEMGEAAQRIAESHVPVPEMNEAALKPFPDFIRNPIVQQRFAAHSLMSFAFVGSAQIVKYVCRYEDLENDFAKICGLAGIEAGPLPILNRSGKRPYRSYYTAADAQVIADVWGGDAVLMGYKYEL